MIYGNQITICGKFSKISLCLFACSWKDVNDIFFWFMKMSMLDKCGYKKMITFDVR
jgi:hypothetical protein